MDRLLHVHSIRYRLSLHDNNGKVCAVCGIGHATVTKAKKIHSASVAKQLHDDSFAFIFGINTLVALTFQTTLTVVLVSEQGLQLDQRTHYQALSGYFFVLGGIYAATSIGQILYRRMKAR